VIGLDGGTFSIADIVPPLLPPMKFCCFCASSSGSPPSPPVARKITGPVPEVAEYSLDGNTCTRHSSTHPDTNACADVVVSTETEEDHNDDDSSLVPQQRKQSVPLLYRKRAFPVPELDMVAGRTPGSAWQAVAAKVVSANRLRRGLGKEVRIEDFRVQELGGRAGGNIFGPVSVFNGNVTFRVKKPLKGITVSVKFCGVTEVDGRYVNFITAHHDLFSGGGFSSGWLAG
jgi:hypothetical protein